MGEAQLHQTKSRIVIKFPVNSRNNEFETVIQADYCCWSLSHPPCNIFSRVLYVLYPLPLFPSSPFLSFILSPMLVHHIWLDSRASIMLLHHVLCHLSWFLNRQEEFLRRSREDSIFCSSYSLLLCPLFIIQCSQ